MKLEVKGGEIELNNCENCFMVQFCSSDFLADIKDKYLASSFLSAKGKQIS